MDDGTALPSERLNLVCKTTEDQREIELPLRLLFVGDYMGSDQRPVEDRLPVRIHGDNFAKVLAAHAPGLELIVTSARAPEGTPSVRASLTFKRLTDFGPDAIAQQVPETSRLLAVRDALTALKGTGDVAAFRARIAGLLERDARARLLSALGLEAG